MFGLLSLDGLVPDPSRNVHALVPSALLGQAAHPYRHRVDHRDVKLCFRSSCRVDRWLVWDTWTHLKVRSQPYGRVFAQQVLWAAQPPLRKISPAAQGGCVKVARIGKQGLSDLVGHPLTRSPRSHSDRSISVKRGRELGELAHLLLDADSALSGVGVFYKCSHLSGRSADWVGVVIWPAN